jgi:anti-sigma28 factor (negative regulator of flagellin synthesis)
MKVSPVSEPLRVSETAPRSAEASPPKQEVKTPAPPVARTALASMTQSSAAMDEADHAARLMSVAMALQSGRYSLDIMRIAEALTRQ